VNHIFAEKGIFMGPDPSVQNSSASEQRLTL